MDNLVFEINADRLFVCDMRPGFTQDGIELSIPSGKYVISDIKVGALCGFQIALEGTSVESNETIGNISIDGATIGVFDIGRFKSYFEDNFEAIYDWSSNAIENEEVRRDISHKHAGSAFAFRTNGDCEVEVISHLFRGNVVGFSVVPIVPTKNENRGERKRSWTWIEFRCHGMFQEFRFCHDRNYDIEFDDVLDDVLGDLCTVETEDSIDFIDEDEIDIDLPINSYRKEYLGLKSVNIFLDIQEGGNTKRKTIHPDIKASTNKINKDSSARDLAQCLFEIYEKAAHLM